MIVMLMKFYSFFLSFSTTYYIDLLFYFLEQIGHLPKGLNPPSLNMLYFSGPYLGVAIKTGIVTGILSLTVSCLIQTFYFFRVDWGFFK